MIKDYRKFCSIHHYFYNGNECPICFQERIQKFQVSEKKTKEKKSDKEISEEMLKKLVDKYKK